jgi:hypothetical protein
VDLSLNDLRSGLHAYSFVNLTETSSAFCLNLGNTNLRSSSLVSNVFGGWGTPGQVPTPWQIWLDNVDADHLNVPTSSQSGDVLSLRYPFIPFAPKLASLDKRIFFVAKFSPPGVPYVFAPPSVQDYQNSLMNFFDTFPARNLFSYTPPGGKKTSRSISVLSLGDVADFDPLALAGTAWSTPQQDGTKSTQGTLLVTLAPLAIAKILAGVTDSTSYCPTHSLLRLMSVPLSKTTPWLNHLGRLTVRGYDLPTPTASSSCIVTDCSAVGGCWQVLGYADTVTLTPAHLQREIVAALNSLQMGNNLAYQDPAYQLWNPALNTSNWVDVNLLCDAYVTGLTLPALPYTDGGSFGAQMSFPPPDALLQCLRYTVVSLSWAAASLFHSRMLSALASSRVLTLTLDLDALFGAILPVPLGLFDGVPAYVKVPVIGWCTTACARIALQQPFIVNGVAQPCPVGYAGKNGTASQLAYCSACDKGYKCNMTEKSLPMACPPGQFQPNIAEFDCLLCPKGIQAISGISHWFVLSCCSNWTSALQLFAWLRHLQW